MHANTAHDFPPAANRLIALPWDSDFFGLPMGQVKLAAADAAVVEAILIQARDQGLALVEAFCFLHDEDSIFALEENGFRYAGVKAYASRLVGAAPEPVLDADQRFGPAAASDIPALVDAFGAIFTDSRYHNYRCLDPAKVQCLYATWIAKAVRGEFDDLCLILRQDKQPAGLCSLRLGEQKARIGLLGVAPSFRGQGAGRLLMDCVAAWLRQASIGLIATATQGKNLAALRFYERTGFLLDTLEMCFYRRLP